MVQLKAWDTYVQEAQREPVVLPIGDNEELTITQPTYGQLVKINAAMQAGDLLGEITAVVGEENAPRLEALFDAAPYTAIVELLRDIVREFGLLPEGEASASQS
jgi:hypothetical protein